MKYEGGNDDLITMAAFRYALGRQTYIVSVIQQFVRDMWPHLSENSRAVIKRDIREAAGRGEANDNYSGLGHAHMDAPGWLEILELEGGDEPCVSVRTTSGSFTGQVTHG